MAKEDDKPKKVKIQALETAKNKPQHMEPGKIYAVAPETAEILIKKKAAKEAPSGAKVGDIVEPKGGKSLTD